MTFKIGTHSGPFHADDVIAVAIMMMVMDDPTNVEIVRSRDQAVLDTCNIRIDVGGKYDVDTRDFDHHFANPPVHPTSGEKLASAGLVWREYGHVLCSNPDVVHAVYQSLIRAVDAYDTGSLESKGHCTIAQVIAGFNPEWDDESQDFDARFVDAMDFAMSVISNEIRRAEASLRAQVIADQAIAQAAGGSIVVTERYAPIMDALITKTDAAFWVYPGPGGTHWMVQCVPPSKGSFDQRVPLLAEWAGLRDGELQAITGLESAVFVHPGRFIGGCASQHEALTMARMALVGIPTLITTTTTV